MAEIKAGEIFNNRMEIKAVFGGNAVQGISPNHNLKLIIAVSDRDSKGYNYRDAFLQDGSYKFYGQRARRKKTRLGAWNNNNPLIRDHLARGYEVVLFVKRGRQYSCEGTWRYNGHREINSSIGGDRCKQVIFNLLPVSNPPQQALDEEVATLLNRQNDLRGRAYAAANETPDANPTTKKLFERSAIIVAYALQRSEGKCEDCGDDGPFQSKRTNAPYLEVHHIDRLTDGGPDDPRRVAAICPTCHRWIHFGDGGSARNNKLRKKIERLEASKGDC